LSSLAAAVVIIFGYHIQSPNSMELNALVNNFKMNNNYNQFTQVIVFYQDKFDFQNFSVFSIIAVSFKHLLKISNEHLNLYLYFQQVITYAVVLA
jgi:hypothetical protein